MTIPLQTKIVYGPLRSRRFGASLGINLLPNDQKICNFDCVYCQYNRSPLTNSHGFPTVRELEAEANQFLDGAKKNDGAIDWITIAGNGEPTLHPHFREAVTCLLSLRDKRLPRARVGILSNSSTCHHPEVRETLDLLDGRFMKLDAGSPTIFGNINHPSSPDGWGKMVAGLRELKDTVIQSLFFDGQERNIEPSQIGDWVDLVNQIQPRSVQVYTIARPTRLEGLHPVSAKTLQCIANELTSRTGIPGEVY